MGEEVKVSVQMEGRHRKVSQHVRARNGKNHFLFVLPKREPYLKMCTLTKASGIRILGLHIISLLHELYEE